MRAGPCVVATDRPATEVCLHSGATTAHGQSKGCHCLQVIALYMQHIAATSNSHLRRHAAFLFRLRVGCALAQAQGGWLAERGAPCVEGNYAPDWFLFVSRLSVSSLLCALLGVWSSPSWCPPLLVFGLPGILVSEGCLVVVRCLCGSHMSLACHVR